MTVGVTADRRAHQQIEILERRGARVVWGPTLQTADLSQDEALTALTRRLIDEPPDVLAVQTGQGLAWWHEAAEAHGLGGPLVAALGDVTILTRGSKATSAARRLGLDVAWQAPNELSTELFEQLGGMDLAGATVAVQLDGGEAVPAALGDLAGCEVVPVEIYRWLLPDDPSPAHRLLDAATDGALDAVTFTASPAIRNLHRLADARGSTDALAEVAADGLLAACVGPVCAATARELGWAGIVEPSRARLVAMIDELGRHGGGASAP